MLFSYQGNIYPGKIVNMHDNQGKICSMGKKFKVLEIAGETRCPPVRLGTCPGKYEYKSPKIGCRAGDSCRPRVKRFILKFI